MGRKITTISRQCGEHGVFENKLNYVCQKVTEIKNALIGNIETREPGLIEETRKNSENIKKNADYIKAQKKGFMSILNAALRTIIILLLTYIAFKLKLTQT